MKGKNKDPAKKSNAVLNGLLAGLGLALFYILIVSIFQGVDFAIYSFSSLKFWLIPLIVGFGTQIGLYTSIRHTAQLNGMVATSGTISGGSMVACCSHFVLNLIPIAGASALAVFLVAYQKWFLGFGIISNIVGISLLLNHRRKMKGGMCR